MNEIIINIIIFYNKFRKMAIYALITGILFIFLDIFVKPVLRFFPLNITLFFFNYHFYLQIIGGIIVMSSIIFLLIPLLNYIKKEE
ncbi:MAG: hypothetical protein WC337_11360 [Candidatus Muiribacteriota bacterium]